MLRGGRGVTLPPLHGLPDVIALVLFLVVVVCIASWIWGGAPLHAVANLLNPPAMATLVRVQVGLAPIAPERQADLLASLPAHEKIPSSALALLERASAALLAERDHWCDVQLNAVSVKQDNEEQAWTTAAARASAVTATHGNDAALTVILLALIHSRKLDLPTQVNDESLDHVLRGLSILKPGRLAAAAVIVSPLGLQQRAAG